MLQKLKTFVEKLKDVSEFDPSVFNDPVAGQTSWKPAKNGGTNFQTHKLVEKDHHRMEFVPTLGATLFCGIFALVGAAVIFLEFFVGIADPQDDPFWGSVFAYMFGLIFLGVGVGIYYFKALPRVFDKWAGLYWKGHKKPANIYDRSSGGEFARFTEIHAIQILSERVRSDKSSYTSYELNLVLGNGERLNVIDHGKKSAILADAQKLSAFLGKPVWDASGMM
jgi:hypothetical protein